MLNLIPQGSFPQQYVLNHLFMNSIEITIPWYETHDIWVDVKVCSGAGNAGAPQQVVKSVPLVSWYFHDVNIYYLMFRLFRYQFN